MFQPWQHADMADKTHKFLAAHRKAHGLTTERLARELGTSKPTISRLENHGAAGAKKTLDWWLSRIADFYKIPVEKLSEPPVGNDSLGGAEQTSREGGLEEESMGPLTLQIERLLKKYDYEKIADKLDEVEARRRSIAPPQQRRRTS